MANNMMNEKNGAPSSFVIGIILLFLFPPLGVILILFSFFGSALKNSMQPQQKGIVQKKTDFSGVSKAMTKGRIEHSHTYDNHGPDYCGTSGAMIQNVVHNHSYDTYDADYCGTAFSKESGSGGAVRANKKSAAFYNRKTTEQIYNELVNRKTDYSGVDPNILKRG